MFNIIKKITPEEIIIGVLSTAIVSSIIIILRKIFNINVIKFINVIFYNIFVYITLFTITFIILYFVCFIIKKFMKDNEIINVYKSYKNSTNWYMMLAEKLIIEELVKRRKLKIFSVNDIDYNLLYEYVDYIEHNFSPDEEVIGLYNQILNKLKSEEYANKLIDNLVEVEFISRMSGKKHFYKINPRIFNYETKEQRKEDSDYDKKQKKLYKDMEVIKIKQNLKAFGDKVKEFFINQIDKIKAKKLIK